MYASPEDVIIRKMQDFKVGGSEKHLRDIRSMIKMSRTEIDLDYIETWAAREGVAEIWEQIRHTNQPDA